MPKGAGPFPAAILVQGSGPQDRDETFGPNAPFRDLAWGLASDGIAVLRYDKRTHAYGTQMAADPNITVREETTDDAVRAVDLLRSTPLVDPARVFLVGHSLGAYLAPRIAAQAAGRLDGIAMLEAPSTALPQLIVMQEEYLDRCRQARIHNRNRTSRPSGRRWRSPNPRACRPRPRPRSCRSTSRRRTGSTCAPTPRRRGRPLDPDVLLAGGARLPGAAIGAGALGDGALGGVRRSPSRRTPPWTTCCSTGPGLPRPPSTACRATSMRSSWPTSPPGSRAADREDDTGSAAPVTPRATGSPRCRAHRHEPALRAAVHGLAVGVQVERLVAAEVGLVDGRVRVAAARPIGRAPGNRSAGRPPSGRRSSRPRPCRRAGRHPSSGAWRGSWPRRRRAGSRRSSRAGPRVAPSRARAGAR